MSVTATSLSGKEIVELCRRHTIYEWSAQAAVDPIPVARAKGIHFWTPEGKRFIDFNSQLMCVNIGHGDERVVRAIQQQVETLAYANPFMATEPRARLGAKLAAIAPGDIDVFFFTNGGAEANENAIKIARMATGRQKILARYRSYHGATAGAMTLTGDPRRWPNEPGLVGVVHVLDPYHGPDRPADDAETALALLEETIELEGPSTIAAFILETVTGTNGVLIPPDGYLTGVRELCDRFGILMIADEVMCGFGRTGEWFAVNHWNVVPDLITVAKGITSSYAPLGAVGIRPHVAAHFANSVFWGGLTYNSHPISVAAALATIRVFEEDGLIENARKMGEVLARHHRDLMDRHPSVGAARNIGLFGILELVKNSRMEPLSPFNVQNETMSKINRFLLDNGVYTMIRWWNVMTNPPLCITEPQLQEGFEVIDRALEIADAEYEG